MKKLGFTTDMERGDCPSCPLNIYDYYNDVGEYRCAFTWDITPYEGKKEDCPLEEFGE